MFPVKRIGPIEVTPFKENRVGLVAKPVTEFTANPVARQIARYGGYDQHADEGEHRLRVRASVSRPAVNSSVSPPGTIRPSRKPVSMNTRAAIRVVPPHSNQAVFTKLLTSTLPI